MERGNFDRRILVGIGIMLLGFLFLANNFSIIHFNIQHYIFRWETIVIVIGLISIFGRGNRSFGLLLVVIGSVFYLRDYLPQNLNFWHIFWAGFLIFMGIMIIFRHTIDTDRKPNHIQTGDHYLDEMAVFGGGDRTILSQEFRGGKITAIFGGLNLNMLKAKLAPGENYLDVFCVFGGMKIAVPEDWTIKIRVMSLFGGFSDKHRIIKSGSQVDESKQLIIKGMVIFGGGEIKGYFD